MEVVFYGIIGIICIYLFRHWFFAMNRVLGRQRHPYLDIDTADWPAVTVLVPAHNEELVIADNLEAMLDLDYPEGLLKVIPINDRSKDKTGEIIDEIAARRPAMIVPFHRKKGADGKAAALADAMELVKTEIVLIFDADYIPGRGLIKQLVAPFFDPEVGAVMGRVVPLNVGRNLLTRALDMERSGGYQVDQQARMNLHLVPQYGGTVGGVRKTALEAVGGWHHDSLAEDTDATFRLLMGGWKTVYQNRSECYEQVPETWPTRMAQIFRWARGHNQVLQRYGWKLLTNRRLRFAEKLDGFLLLHVYVMSLVLLLGWGLGVILWYLAVLPTSLLIILAVTSYSTLGNFALFFEIAAANHLDGSHGRVKLLPFILLGFLVSLISVTRATLTQFLGRGPGKGVRWEKTERTPRRTQWE
ncbi:MAG: glycosyltransferase family 2 protein [bacterium]|nr:glycosyltransferase family 2 protein [bacterium]